MQPDSQDPIWLQQQQNERQRLQEEQEQQHLEQQEQLRLASADRSGPEADGTPPAGRTQGADRAAAQRMPAGADKPARTYKDGLIAAVILAAIVGVLYYFAKPSTPSLPQASLEPQSAAVAAPEPSAPPEAGPEAPVASSGALPHPEIPNATTLPDASLEPLPADAEGESSQQSSGELAQALTRLEAAHSDLQALEQRVAALEAGLARASEQIQSLPQAGRTQGETQDDGAPLSSRPAAKRSKASVAGQRIRKNMDAPVKPQGELLAVDIWDGRPSVIVGTGVAGDGRIRVMQPGEQMNGIGLLMADVVKGRATFSARQGSPFTLSVAEEGQEEPQ